MADFPELRGVVRNCPVLLNLVFVTPECFE
jgi:hypothetical protein